MKEIKTEISIDASPEKVWEILTSFNDYPKWNPLIRSISGELETGKKLIVNIKLPGSKGVLVKPEIKRVEEYKELRWKGKFLFKGLFDGEHYFMIKKNGEGSSIFIHGEIFNGILVSLLKGILEKTLVGFEEMNKALKHRAED
jgi:hypothetical protein